jgi:serine/threonine-protein kinase
MKKFFSSIFLSRKKEESKADLSLSEVLSFLETKMFPCSECGHFIQLDNPEPLSLASCSKCGNQNFIPLKLGPFWLYRYCGDGGMGYVYKAVCSLVPGREFAIKVLPRKFRGDAGREADLQREAEITALFNDHPNSVRVVEFDSENELAYMATEYIDGKLLNVLIEEKGRLPEAEAVKYTMDLLSIIEEIYSKGYLYRDLKPQNLIIDKQGKLILIDYGICLPKGSAAYQQEEVIDGSPHFLPPERLTGEGEDIRSEIYSIGMLMYYMLTGKTYFRGTDLQEIAEQHVNGSRHESLLAEMGAVHEDLVYLIERMIQRKKRKRVASLSEIRGVGLRYFCHLGAAASCRCRAF